MTKNDLPQHFVLTQITQPSQGSQQGLNEEGHTDVYSPATEDVPELIIA